MKIYFSHSRQGDYENELYKPLRAVALKHEHDIILSHEGGRHVKTKDEIQASDLMVAEVSFPKISIGIEIGWADSADVPLLCIYKTGAKISSSLNFLTKDFIEYSTSEDMILKLSDYLQARKF